MGDPVDSLPYRIRSLEGVHTSPFVLQVKLSIEELSDLFKVTQKQKQN